MSGPDTDVDANTDVARLVRVEPGQDFTGTVTVTIEGPTAAVDALASRVRTSIDLEPGMPGIPSEAGRHTVNLADALTSLPPEELAAGYAEVVKTALIAGGGLWEQIRGGAGWEGRTSGQSSAAGAPSPAGASPSVSSASTVSSALAKSPNSMSVGGQ